ncbi:MAG: cell envelope biogenesis protein LolA [Prevotella sp.]|nr:cell envelope biogenesis protein LolA [Prevotella sp.]
MKKIVLVMTALILVGVASWAQTAQQVLDKCAATVSVSSGVTANFTMNSAQYGNASGTISIKGQKFYMHTSTTTMWFDGKTLWTYMASNDEVNISTPTAQQLQTLNPYNFINLYKSGYSSSLTTAGSDYQLHLTSTKEQHKIKEAFLLVDKSSYVPKEIKTLMGNKWTIFTISGLKTEQLNDAMFRFDSKDYPDAEIIDLR